MLGGAGHQHTPSPPPHFTVRIPIKGWGECWGLKDVCNKGQSSVSWARRGSLGIASSSPSPSQESYRGYPINNFQLHLTLQSQTPSLRSSPVEFPPQPVIQVAPGAAAPLAALAGFAAHLAEVGSATELKFEHQWAVGHLVHILAFFWAIPRGHHHAVTLGLTLLHGRWPQSLGALSRWLASVAGAAHRALLLAEATL